MLPLPLRVTAASLGTVISTLVGALVAKLPVLPPSASTLAQQHAAPTRACRSS
jgi:hypothetical protein